jgi:uncharacterized protein (DUF736 family)
MDCSIAAVTVSVALAVTAFPAADTVTVPGFRVVTKPVEFTVATVVSDVDQVAVVSALEVPSEKVPVAVNCCVSPAAIDDPWGDTVMDCRIAAVTVSAAFPVTALELADTVTAPGFRVVTNPVELTVASVGSEVDQVTVVSALELPSEKFPVAVNCCVSPAATDGPWGDTVIACRVTGDGNGLFLLPPPQATRIPRLHTATTDKHRHRQLELRQRSIDFLHATS